MRLFLPFLLLCLLVVVSCKKAEQQSKDKSHVWSEKKSHNVKKYKENVHHHDKHQKEHHQHHSVKHGSHVTDKKHKTEAHHGYHDVPKHEAELQQDIKSTKKEIADRLAKEEQDLHLQDLTHPDDPANAGHKNNKSPHQHQRGHHKTNKHSSQTKVPKAEHHQVEDEKLFVFPDSKQAEPKQSHSVLEDSFEALSEDALKEQPKDSHTKKKDYSKNKGHKKAYEKTKEKTKNKEYEKIKNKEDKKTKKEHKGKKEKKQW